MSARLILRLLIAFALAFSGGAAQLHSLAHAQSELAAARGHDASDHNAPSPLKHSADQCLVVHALDATAADSGDFPAATGTFDSVVPIVRERRGESPAAAFLSRAPPLPA